MSEETPDKSDKEGLNGGPLSVIARHLDYRKLTSAQISNHISDIIAAVLTASFFLNSENEILEFILVIVVLGWSVACYFVSKPSSDGHDE